MKYLHSLIFLLAFLTTSVLYGQYLPFYQDQVYHFENDDVTHFQLPLEIDTIIDHGGYLSYVPFRMIQNPGDTCAKADQYHWIGDRIDVYPDGKHIIHIPGNKEFEIRTQSSVGEKWTAMVLESGSVKIEVLNMYHDSMSGTTDSIKTFGLKSYDENGIEIDNQFSGLEIRLSKLRGYLAVPVFSVWSNQIRDIYNFNFGVCEISDNENLTWEEVFDFEVGDELHIYIYETYYHSFIYYMKFNILEKTETAGNYKYIVSRNVHHEQRRYYTDSIILEEEYRDTVIWSYSKSKPSFDEIGFRPYFGGSPYSLSFNFPFRSRDGIRSKAFSSKLYDYDQGDSCLSEFIEAPLEYSYVDHMGGPYYSGTTQLGTQVRQLKYFANDSFEIGMPLDSFFTSTNERPIESGQLDIIISPNPVGDELNVSWRNMTHIRSLDLFNSQGMPVHQAQIMGSDNYFIDACRLKPGMYFGRMADQVGHVFTFKFLKN